jgi:cytochrome c biogenesis protein
MAPPCSGRHARQPVGPFSYLRIPADDGHSVTEWMRLRAACKIRTARRRRQRYAVRAMPKAPASLAQQLQASADKSLASSPATARGRLLAISRSSSKNPGSRAGKSRRRS